MSDVKDKPDKPKSMPPVEYRFKPGQSGNPGGVSNHPKIKAFKDTTYKEFMNQLQKYGSFTREEMKEELQRPDATMFELMFGNIVASAARGDKDARQLLLDRLWGKVKEVQEHHVHAYDSALDEVPKEMIINLLKASNE